MSLVLHDEKDYEIISGQKIYMMARPSLNHIDIASNIRDIFKRLLKGKTCKPYVEPDVYLDDDNHFIPDVVILCDRSKHDEKRIYGAPDLVVEILSPSTAKRDIADKKDIYGKYGVKEYWIVRPEFKEITVYHLKDNLLIVDNVYYYRTKEELETMREDDQKAVMSTLKISFFEELEINLEEIFDYD